MNPPGRMPAFEMPDDLRALVQRYLGRRALAIQAETGRGCWLAQDIDGGSAAYIPLAAFPLLYGGGSMDDFGEVMTMIKTFDPTTQVVVLFNYADDLQFAVIVDID